MEKFLNLYIGYLRALYFIHQNNHWTTCGSNFYSNHQLFERLYSSVKDHSDTAAEKFIGVFDLSVDVKSNVKVVSELVSRFDGDEIESSLVAEEKFLEFSKTFYEFLKKEDKMSLGLDDMIMSIASDHETFVYLLKQTKKGKNG